MDQTIKLELTVDEVNTVLRSLGQHPFEQIAALISKIRDQGEAQVRALEEAAQAAAAQAAAEATPVEAE
jgi:malate/lactate dehydrogenase